jgi:hypothetical protein
MPAASREDRLVGAEFDGREFDDNLESRLTEAFDEPGTGFGRVVDRFIDGSWEFGYAEDAPFVFGVDGRLGVFFGIVISLILELLELGFV